MKLSIDKKAIKFIVAFFGVLLFVLALFLLINKFESKLLSPNHGAIPPDDGRIMINDKWYVPNNNIESVLFIGLDKYTKDISDSSYNNSCQSDLLCVLVIDKKQEQSTILQLNRDTIAQIPMLDVTGKPAGEMKGQLALAHTYGSGKADSCRNTVKAVSSFLYGAKINHYISLSLDAVTEINDSVGGVKVMIEDDMTAVDSSLIKGSEVLLLGDSALNFVRARGSLEDSSNIARMGRHRLYISSLREAVKNKTDLDENFFAGTLETLSKHMVSDCTVNQLSTLYDRFSKYESCGIKTIDGEAKLGEKFMEFYADDSQLKQTVVELFYVPLND